MHWLRNLSIAALWVGCLALSSRALAGPYDGCFDAAGKFYQLTPALLQAIAQVESGGNPRAINANPNGSEDIGLMQVNSWWLPTLASYGIGRSDLLSSPCTNIHVGAWILRQEIARHGYTWRAVGAYNAKSAEKAQAYGRRVFAMFLKLGGAVPKRPPRKSPPDRSPIQPHAGKQDIRSGEE